MLVKKLFIFLVLFIFSTDAFAVTPRSTGKYKNWESFIAETDKGKICFAQTVPTRRAPAAVKRNKSKLFVTFRPSEEIKAPVTAKSGKKSYDLFSKGRFAWVVDNKDETKLILTMKKASRLMIIGNTNKGEQTTDHYSMMGFTKAYNSAKKSCS